MDEVRNQMKEVNRFSFHHNGRLFRNIVFRDSEGFFHIKEETYVDPDKVDPVTKQPTPLTTRESVHGKMTTEAYANWLSNILYNECFRNPYNSNELRWLVGE